MKDNISKTDWVLNNSKLEVVIKQICRQICVSTSGGENASQRQLYGKLISGGNQWKNWLKIFASASSLFIT